MVFQPWRRVAFGVLIGIGALTPTGCSDTGVPAETKIATASPVKNEAAPSKSKPEAASRTKAPASDEGVAPPSPTSNSGAAQERNGAPGDKAKPSDQMLEAKVADDKAAKDNVADESRRLPTKRWWRPTACCSPATKTSPS